MYNFRGNYKKNFSDNSHAQSILEGGRTSELLNACQSDSTDAIMALLSKEGVDPNEVDSKSNSPLLWATFHNNITVIDKLLSNFDININAQNKMKETALHYAAKNGNLDLIKKLIDRGANFKAKNLNNKLPSQYAEEAKQSEAMGYLVKLELSNDAQQQLKTNENRNVSEFFNILLEGNIDKVKNYLSQNNKQQLLNSTDSFGRNCLLYAIENNNPDIAKYFIEAGVNINHQDSEQKTALHELCNSPSSYPDVLSLLIQKGADFTIIDNDGDTPLMVALKSVYDYLIIESFFKDAKQFNNATLSKSWQIRNLQDISALSYILDQQQFDILELVIEYLDDLDLQMPKNSFLIIEIAKMQNLDYISKIALKTSNLNRSDSQNFTLMHILSEDLQKYESIIIDLMQNKTVDLSIQNSSGDTPLLYLIQRKASCQFIKKIQQTQKNRKTLIQAWSVINSKGESPLSFLIQTQQFDILEVVIDFHDNLDLKMPNNSCFIFELAKTQKSSLMEKALTKINDFHVHDEQKNTIMHILCQSIQAYENIVLNLLDTKDVDLMLQNNDGNTALFILLQNKISFKVTEKMLQVKFFSRDFNKIFEIVNKNKENLEALFLKQNDRELYASLIKFQNQISDIKQKISEYTLASILEPENLNTLLVTAIKNHELALWNELLSLGIKVNAKDIKGCKDVDPYQNFPGHTAAVTAIAFSPDGQKVASGSFDCKMLLWDIKQGNCIRTYYGHPKPINCITYASDGQTILTGSQDNRIKIWDANDMSCLKTLYDHDKPVLDVVCLSNTLITCSEDTKIKQWDQQSSQPRKSYFKQLFSFSVSMALSPDGRKAVSCSSKSVTLLDIQTEQTSKLSGNSDRVQCFAFSHDSTRIAAGTLDNKVILWDVNSRILLKILTGHENIVQGVSFSHSNKQIISGSNDGIIKIWEISSGKSLQTIKAHASSVRMAIFSPDDKMIASCSDDKTIKLWNVEEDYKFIKSLRSSYLDEQQRVSNEAIINSIQYNCAIGSVLLELIRLKQTIQAIRLIQSVGNDKSILEYSNEEDKITPLQLAEQLNLNQVSDEIKCGLGIKVRGKNAPNAQVKIAKGGCCNIF